MANNLELMLEAKRRGILPADKAELLAEAERRGLVKEPTRIDYRDPAQITQSVGPSSTPQSEFDAGVKRDMAETSNMEPAFINRPSTQEGVRDALPMLTGALASFGGGPGAGLLTQSALAGGGATIGDLFRQKLEKPLASVDPMAAVKEGGVNAAGTMAGGLVLKGLGATAKKLFASPLSKEATQAAEFAKSKGVPFPLSSGAPGSPASILQNVSRGTVAGELKTHADAVKVAQYLNRNINGQGGELMNAKPVAEAAKQGQQWLRSVFEPGETIYKQNFQSFFGKNQAAAVPLNNAASAIDDAVSALAARGETEGAVYKRLVTVLDGITTGKGAQSAKQLDELATSLVNEASKNTATFGEVHAVRSAILKDLDAIAPGYQQATVAADKVRDSWRELKNIPHMMKLSKEFGGKGGVQGDQAWMAALFRDPDGRALAQIRKLNPQMYHDLADSWLASNLNKFSRSTDGQIGRTLDGPALRNWVEQNSTAIKTIFGAPQAQALDNFSLYAKYMSGAARKADTTQINPATMLFRGGAEVAGAGFVSVPLVVSGEGGAFLLARGLSDPSSSLFNLFTKGVSPTAKNAWKAGATVAGQSGAKAYADAR